MDIISIKVHPPWYARGTPITNTRDGPPFDLSAYVVPDNVKMEAIREGPSARGNPAEVRSRQSAVGSQNHDSYRMEDQSRGNPGRKTRLWLTLKTTFSNTQNGVYGQWYAQTRRVDKIIGDKISISSKPRRGKMIIAMAKIVESKTQRVEMIIENDMTYKPKTRRVDKIIGKNEWRKYHPAGVSVPHFNSCYNHNIPLGLRTKPRRVDKIIDDKICISNKTRRVAMIIENDMTYNPKTRRVDKIIAEKSEWRNYHPVGVSDPNRLLCYNHNIPSGIKPKIQRVEMIIENDMTYKSKTRRVDKIIDDKICISTKPRRGKMIIAMAKIVESQTRRVAMIIENGMTYKPKTRRVDKIIDKNDVIRSQPRRGKMIIAMAKIVELKTQRVDKIIGKNEWRKYHPVGVSVPHRLLCYNHNIPLGLSTKPRRGNMIIENDMTYKPKTRRVDKIIDDKICISTKPRRGKMIIAMAKIVESQTRRVERIIDMISFSNIKIRLLADDKIIGKNEWRNYHPAGVSVPHRLLCYNHHIPLGLKTKPTFGRINLIAI